MKSICAVTADGQTVFKDCTPQLIGKCNCSIHVNMLHVCVEAQHWSCRFFALPPTSVPKAGKAPEDQARILQKGIRHKSRARSNQSHFRHFAIAIAWSPVTTAHAWTAWPAVRRRCRSGIQSIPRLPGSGKLMGALGRAFRAFWFGSCCWGLHVPRPLQKGQRNSKADTLGMQAA